MDFRNQSIINHNNNYTILGCVWVAIRLAVQWQSLKGISNINTKINFNNLTSILLNQENIIIWFWMFFTTILRKYSHTKPRKLFVKNMRNV